MDENVEFKAYKMHTIVNFKMFVHYAITIFKLFTFQILSIIILIIHMRRSVGLKLSAE